MAYLGLNATNYHVGLKRAESAGKAFASNVKRYFASAFGAAALIAFTTKIVNAADEILDLSDRLDMNAQKLQEWIYAAKKSGAEIGNLTTFFESLAKAREKALGGDAQTIEDFAKLGVSMVALRNGDFQTVAEQIGKTLQGGNAKELLPALSRIGGKGAGALIPTLRDFEKLSEQGNKWGQILDNAVLLKLKAIKSEITGINDEMMAGGAKVLAKYGLPLVMMLKDLNMYFAKGSGAATAALLSGGGIAGMQAALIRVREEIQEARKQSFNTLRSDFRDREGLGDPNGVAPSRASFFNSGRVSGLTPDRMFDALRVAGMRAILPTGDKPQLNEWQRLGAATRSTTDNKLTLISDHTKQAAERLQTLVRLNKGNFGAEESY
jgi:hypothetical protein